MTVPDQLCQGSTDSFHPQTGVIHLNPMDLRDDGPREKELLPLEERNLREEVL